MAAALAALDVTTEGGGAAGLDPRHHLELAEADMAGMGRAPGRPVSAQDVGNLQRGAHGAQPLDVAPSLTCMLIWAVILSSRLVTVRTILVATRV